MNQEDVTIIVPTLSNELSDRALNLCLDSLGDIKCDIEIAENGPDTDYPQGQCTAVNRIAKSVKTEWIFIANNDMIFPPNWFKIFTDTVDNYKLLVASPNLVEPQKGAPPFIEKFCGGIGTVDTEPDFDKQCFLDFVEGHKEHENRPENTIEDGFNFPVLIRKDVWDTVGGYDESYDPWGSNSDSDLQHKLMIAGIIPKRVKSALVYHFSQTSGTFHPDHRDKWEENKRYFTGKWGFEREASPGIWYRPTIPYKELKYKPKWKCKYGYSK